MSFEAVPCMFQSTATDGNSASYIGLLIRPSNSATVAQTPTVIPAVVAPSINVQKPPNAVPSAVLKIPFPQKSGKNDLPNSVFRLQSTACPTSQCDSWIQRNSRSNGSGSFEPSSSSQVTAQMNTGDDYNAVSCPSTNSFFPPISTIAQSFSSGKSNINFLSDPSPVPGNSNQQLQSNYCVYSQSNISNQRCNTAAVSDNRFSQLPGEVSLNRSSALCKYQNSYNVTNDCSATPDSGIQSIGDSPRSIGPFVTPMPSPAAFTPMASNEFTELASGPSTSFDDFSDMPRLVPYHQMDEPCCSNCDEAPQITDATRSENEEMGHEEPVPKIAITPSVNVNELVEQLMSHLGPEQRKQFADAIKSKVVEEFEKGNSDADNHISPPNDGSVEEEVWEAVAAEKATEQSKNFSDRSHLKRCEVSSSVANSEAVYERSSSLNNQTEELWSGNRIEEFSRKNDMPLLENEQQELCDDEIAFVCQLATEVSEEETKKRKVEEVAKLGTFFEEGNSSESSPKEAILDLDLTESNTPFFDINHESPPLRQESTLENKSNESTKSNNGKRVGKKRKLSRRDQSKGRKLKLVGSDADASFSFIETQKFCEKGAPVPEVVEMEKFDGSTETPVESCSRSDNTLNQSNLVTCGVNRDLDEESKERLRVFRLNVRKKMNDQLECITEKVQEQFANLELKLGPRMHWELPWYRLNWEQVAQRIAERNRIEKIAKEKAAAVHSATPQISKKKSRRKLLRKNSLVSTADVSEPPFESTHTLNSYIEIKHNVIVDVYPKAEPVLCSCEEGCCDEKDQCINRLNRIECSSSCPCNKHCANRRISKREYKGNLKTFEAANGKNIGVKTFEMIKEGQYICEYLGEVLSVANYKKRLELIEDYKKNFAMTLCDGFVVDAYLKGNIARFINYSCSPNCEIQKWSVNGQRRIGVFALHDIGEGEELTINFNLCAYNFTADIALSNRNLICKIDSKKSLQVKNGEKRVVNKNRLSVPKKADKSAKQKTLIAQPKKPQAVRESLDSFERHKVLREYCDELFAVLTDFATVPKRHMVTLHTSIDSLLEQSLLDKQNFLLKEIEAGFQTVLDTISKHSERKKFETLKSKIAVIKSNYSESLKIYGPLPQTFEEKGHSGRKKLNPPRILTAKTDLSYLDSNIAVGSYDPDDISNLGEAEADSDCVRCICGITDDDGSMIQCDTCHFWLHDDCVYFNKLSTVNAEFTCDFCKNSLKRTPAVDIPLYPQPEIKLAGCIYYRTLTNSQNIQVRLNETVYTQKLKNDDHKAELKRLSEISKDFHGTFETVPAMLQTDVVSLNTTFRPTSFSRQDLRCFRVERLFVSPEGHKFVFGSHYARPHEVYCEPGRMFHKNELFATSMFDTLPLDAVVGRCLALEPRVYCLGRPKMPRYYEEDVYFYEFQQNGKNSRYFEKISSKNHYYINTGPHNFVYFPKKAVLERNFTPFVLENTIAGCAALSHQSASSSDSIKRPTTLSRRYKKNKVARLEKLVLKLTAQPPGSSCKDVDVNGRSCISSIHKRVKQ